MAPKYAKLMQRLLFLSMFLSFIFFSSNIYQSYQGPKAAGFVFFATLLLFSFLKYGNPGISLTPLPIAAALFFLWMVFRALSSPCNPRPYYLAAFISPAAFFLPQLVKINTAKFLFFLSAIVLLSSFYAFCQVFSGAVRPYSFFGNPIFFGEFLLLCFPVLAAAFVKYKNHRQPLFIILVLAFACMVLSGSRGVLFSLFISLTVLFLLFFRTGIINARAITRSKIYLASALLFFTILLLTPNFRSSIFDFLSRVKDMSPANSASIHSRALLARSAAAMIKEKPFAGSGAGGFGYFYQLKQAPFLKTAQPYNFIFASYAHNDYLQIASEAGLAGLVLFIFFIFSLFTRFDSGSAELDKGAYIICCGFLCSACGCLTESFFNFPLFILPCAALFWLFCGFVFFMLPAKKTFSVPSKYLSAALLSVVITAAFGVPADFLSGAYLSGAASAGIKYSAANKTFFDMAVKYGPENYAAYSIKGGSLAVSGMYPEAVLSYDKALALRPYSADLLFNKASVLHRQKEFKQAEIYFRQALELYPGFAACHMGLAKTLMELKMENEAAAEFAAAVSLDSSVSKADFSGNVVDFREATWIR